MKTKTITLRRLRAWEACERDYQVCKALYPKGIPVTREAAYRLLGDGVDVVWGLCHLLSAKQRRQFILLTLRQRQPHLVSLLRKANLNDHAAAVEGLAFVTPADAQTAQSVLAAAWDAARDAAGTAAWDAAWAAAEAAWAAANREQVDWLLDVLEVPQ